MNIRIRLLLMQVIERRNEKRIKAFNSESSKGSDDGQDEQTTVSDAPCNHRKGHFQPRRRKTNRNRGGHKKRL